jgi:hypothetical protein
MLNQTLAVLFFTGLVSFARAETFVIPAQQSGHEATVSIPGSAVTGLSANFAEPIVDHADSQAEIMRLTGDVIISVAGSAEPIHIKADSLVLTLIPDAVRGPDGPAAERPSRADPPTHEALHGTTTLPGDDNSEVFVGSVVFKLDTAAGPMQIKAERVEHRLRPDDPAPKAAS